MAYTKAGGKAVAKYDKTHYKKVGIKVPLDIFDLMKQCENYKIITNF